jgi:hypothetical protein
VMYGIFLSEMAVGIETMLLARYPRMRDRLSLFAAAFLEFAGYHQILAVERVVSMFQIRRRRGIWGQMRRTGEGQDTARPPTDPEAAQEGLPPAEPLSPGPSRRADAVR